MDVLLIEIFEINITLFVDDVAYLRPAEYGQTVRAFFNDVVPVNDGNVDAVNGRCNGSYGRNGANGRIVSQWLVEGDVAAVDVVRNLRLEEMPFEVDAHEDRTEIAHFVVVLYFFDGNSVDVKVGY